MNFILAKEDRRAVDLLLDRSAKAAGNGSGHAVYASADPTLGQRIVRAQRLLQLLELFPGTEPPADLVMRTLRYIEQAGAGSVRMRPDFPNLISGQHPHA